MSHDTIDPRPEQYQEAFPFKETCLFPATASCQAASGGKGCEPCDWQIFWGVQTYSDRYRFKPVIEAVDQLGVRENTYIIFSTDNGAQAERWTNGAGGSGPDGTTSGAFTNAVGTQGPFRGCKASLYDGGHRVPFIVTGPGVPKRRVDHSVISAVDWLPTITKLAKAKVPEGTLLRGTDISGIWHGAESNVIKRSKLLIWRGGGGPPPCWNLSPHLAIREGDWKLLFNPTGSGAGHGPDRIELYNMSINQLPELSGTFFEAQNEAKGNPEVVQRLMAKALSWHHHTPCPFNTTSMAPAAGANTCADGRPTGCEAYPFPGMVPDGAMEAGAAKFRASFYREAQSPLNIPVID